MTIEYAKKVPSTAPTSVPVGVLQDKIIIVELEDDEGSEDGEGSEV